MPAHQDLQDLVETPSETLSVEIKSDLNLDERLAQANLARHIAALANHGGGFIVFGFDDNLAPQDLPGDIDSNFHRDRVSAIVSRFLIPTLLCDVTIVTAQSGRRHPIIRVPSHDVTPICAKVDGPQFNNRVEGIVTLAAFTLKLRPFASWAL